ncbi:MAG: preprotein translocase subunit SecY [bacterium]|nr:preprotein translocase subunit SecY [bacterium]
MIKVENLADIFKIEDLRKKFIFTLMIIAVYRLGAAIPTPGIDGAALKAFFATQNNTLFGFLDMFSGGAMNKFSIFSMGIMPYINASIIMSLLQTIVPSLEKLSKEGEAGRKKLIQITRYGTLGLGLIQSFGLTYMIQAMRSPSGAPVVIEPGLSFQLLAVLTLTTGTVFIMWLGEQITEKGIGNGISLIIFAGIVNRLPAAIKNVFLLLQSDGVSILKIVFILALILVVIALVVRVEQGQRRIPIQYPKKYVGRKEAGGQSSFLPIKVDQSGVISVIFAISIISFPITLAQFFPEAPTSKIVMSLWSNAGVFYHIIFAALIIFFCYFYTSITFNPNDIAENMKKSGGFIPGIRPGEATAKFIEYVVIRITFFGAIFIAALAVMPDILRKALNAPFYFGGTALLIAVGVAIDFISQLESNMIMRHYDGFMDKGRIKGRYFNIK